jgi:hypothetical protein
VTAQSELYEVVGILKAGRSTVFLDDFATNEPVVDAASALAIGDADPVTVEPKADGLALTPLLFGAGEAGREILHPVAVTAFGGLLSATALDTVLTPVLFLTIGRKPLERLLASHSGKLEPSEAY